MLCFSLVYASHARSVTRTVTRISISGNQSSPSHCSNKKCARFDSCSLAVFISPGNPHVLRALMIPAGNVVHASLNFASFSLAQFFFLPPQQHDTPLCLPVMPCSHPSAAACCPPFLFVVLQAAIELRSHCFQPHFPNPISLSLSLSLISQRQTHEENCSELQTCHAQHKRGNATTGEPLTVARVSEREREREKKDLEGLLMITCRTCMQQVPVSLSFLSFA